MDLPATTVAHLSPAQITMFRELYNIGRLAAGDVFDPATSPNFDAIPARALACWCAVIEAVSQRLEQAHQSGRDAERAAIIGRVARAITHGSN